jgi:hypothetical protein
VRFAKESASEGIAKDVDDVLLDHEEDLGNAKGRLLEGTELV